MSGSVRNLGRRTLAAALVVAGLLAHASPVRAENAEVPLRQTAAPAQHLLPDVGIDGLRLGASPDEIVKALSVIDPTMQVRRTMRRLTVTVGGKQMTSEPT